MRDKLGPQANRVYVDVRDRIQAGEPAAGASLPSHAELAREYGVALMTVRQAIARLESDGLVTVKMGSGTFVQDPECEGRAVPVGFESVVCVSPLAVVTFDPHGNVTSWNPAAKRMFGWSSEEAVGRKHPAVSEDELQEYDQHVRRLASGEVIDAVDVRRRTRDGSEISVTVHAAPLRDAEGRVVGSVSFASDVTARTSAEAETRASESRFRATFDRASIGIALIALDGRFILSNPACQQFLGYSDQELRQMTFQEVTHPHDLEMDLQLADELTAGRRDSYRLEKRYIRKDGQIVWGHLTGSLIRDESGKPELAVAMIEDITGRKRSEAALQESRERYCRLVEEVNDPIFTIDLDGRLVSMNARAERILGYARPRVPELTLPQIVAQRSLAHTRTIIADTLARESHTGGIIEMVTASGDLFPLPVRSHALIEDGKPVGVLVIGRATQNGAERDMPGEQANGALAS